MDKYLNTREACEILGIKEFNTLYEYIKSGKLKAYKLGGRNSKRHWRIKAIDLEAFVTGQGSELKHTEASKNVSQVGV